MAYADLPRSLLLPEVSALLHYLPDWSQHALVSTLWNTGGRINEVLTLKRRDFRLNGDYPHVVIRTAAQGPAARPREAANRVVPLSYPWFVDELRRLFASTRERIETDSQTGEHRPLPIWRATDRTVRNWLTRVVDEARRDGVTFSVPVTPHVFRHSYAMHHCYQHTPLNVLQTLLGHEKAESKEVYTRVFALDIAASQQVTFSMPESQAESVMVRNQGSQYGSDDWQRFCRDNNLTPSMSRRGNCWDNAVAESFFSSLKKRACQKENI